MLINQKKKETEIRHTIHENRGSLLNFETTNICVMNDDELVSDPVR